MASRRQKKKVAKRKQLQKQINALKQIRKEQTNREVNIRKYNEKELRRLQDLTGVNSTKNYNEAIERARNINDIDINTRASKIGGYYKHDLIERYYDLVNAGYITSRLSEQEVYNMAPQIIEETTDEEELQRMVAEGEKKMAMARQKNLRAREQNMVVFDW